MLGTIPKFARTAKRHIMKVAFTMKLHPGCAGEYRRRHAQIWPELVSLLREHGIREYLIFLDEATGTLFAVQQVEEVEVSLPLDQDPLMRRWWAHMADIMDTHPDQSPVCGALLPVFDMP